MAAKSVIMKDGKTVVTMVALKASTTAVMRDPKKAVPMVPEPLQQKESPSTRIQQR